jgi:hypothetical protein
MGKLLRQLLGWVRADMAVALLILSAFIARPSWFVMFTLDALNLTSIGDYLFPRRAR